METSPALSTETEQLQSGPRELNALLLRPSLQRLVDKGAVVVGVKAFHGDGGGSLHAFCGLFDSQSGLVQQDARLQARGVQLEWADAKRDLRAMQEVEAESEGRTWYLRTDVRGVCHDVLQAAGVAVPPTVRS